MALAPGSVLGRDADGRAGRRLRIEDSAETERKISPFFVQIQSPNELEITNMA